MSLGQLGPTYNVSFENNVVRGTVYDGIKIQGMVIDTVVVNNQLYIGILEVRGASGAVDSCVNFYVSNNTIDGRLLKTIVTGSSLRPRGRSRDPGR